MTRHLILAAVCLLPAAARAERPCLNIGRTAHPPVIDGRISPGEWDGAARIPWLLTMGGGSIARPRTIAAVTYDDKAIYVAVRCTETDPTYPRGFVRPHDDRAFEDSCVRVYLAPENIDKAKRSEINFGGYQGAYNTWYADIAAYYEFTVNCMGSTTEARNDVRDWNAKWYARASRDKGGWTAEIEIPFAALGQKAPADGTLWGFNLYRYRPPDLQAFDAAPFGGYTPQSLGAVVFGDKHPAANHFTPPPPPAPQPAVDYGLHYFAAIDKVEGRVHLSQKVAHAHAFLALTDASGVQKRVDSDLTPAHGALLTLNVKGSVGASYVADLEVSDSAGAVLVSKKINIKITPKPAWLGTAARMHPGVLPPWTPIKVHGRVVSMLGKRLQYADLALPAAIRSAGGDMLTAPIHFVVASGGKVLKLKVKSWRILQQAPNHVKIESVATAGNLTLRITSNIEYDGFTWNVVTLSGGEVDRLAMEIPLRKEDCRYAYEGLAQRAHALSPFGLRRTMSDNLWIGGAERGIAFLAESLEWSLAHDRARQVEVIPEGKGWVWRSTFIDTPMDLAKPYTARFALHITPTKPVSLRKSRIFHGAWYGLATAHASASLSYPAKGHIDLAHGTLELWVKPTFDTGKAYDPKVGRSSYNRQFFAIPTDVAGEIMMLYYNADDRSFRAVTHNAAGKYPVIVSGPVKLPKNRWSYVAMSWGKTMRVSINGHVAEAPMTEPVRGSVENSKITFSLNGFDIDEVRISSEPRPIDKVPTAPFVKDAQTLLLDHCESHGPSDSLVAGKFGHGRGGSGELEIDRLAKEGKRIVIFHETWSRYQGYPDLAQIPKLRKIADACHKRGMLFLVYFNQDISTAAPEWKTMRDDLLRFPEERNYHRNDVPQDCYTACVNGPYGDLLLAGIQKLADQAGIDGVYMDGTTVPWVCANPSHPGCGEVLPDGSVRPHSPIRAVRAFMKRLRWIFAKRGKPFFLDAHTGGSINVATQSFCDGYLDGETLERYKPGFRLSPDTFLTGYMGKQFGFRGQLLATRFTMNQALAISLVHDTATRGEPAAVDLAWGPYESADTQFIGYWKKSPLYKVEPAKVLGSLYLKKDRALIVLGSQTEKEEKCVVDVRGVLARLPKGVKAVDAISGKPVAMKDGKMTFPLAGQMWRMIDIK